MIVTKGKGIEINQQDGIPLTSEHNFYWDPFLANILLHDAHEFCPRVNFKRTPGSPDFQTVFMQSAQDKGGAVDHDQIMPGSEICGTSKSLADQKVRIPVQDVDAFVRAIRENLPSPCDEIAGFRSTYLAQRAIESIELKRTLPVPIEKITPCIL